MFLGGRVAEALVLKDISSGASSDLERATHLARRMVCEYGMSDKLGSMTFGHPDGQVFLGRDITRERNYSDQVAAVIDEEVHKLMDEAYKNAEKMLTEHMDKLHLIAETLLEKETLEAADLRMLMQEGHLPESETETVTGTPAAEVASSLSAAAGQADLKLQQTGTPAPQQ